MKIGILTLPINTNYGAILQAYALQYSLKKLGHDAWFVKRRWNSEDQSVLHKISKYVYHKLVIRKFNHFINKYISPQTGVIDTIVKVNGLLSEGFDAFVVGSDQVWRMRNVYGAGYSYFLDFVPEGSDIKRISYAASFGVDYWDDTKPEKSIPIVRSLLQKFDSISVRENSGVNICNEVFNVAAVSVLDPTLLINKEEYINNFSLKDNKKTNYIAVYILDMTPEKQSIIETISKELSLPVKSINEEKTLLSKIVPHSMLEISKPCVKEWLEGINNASFVVTDSFHGTVFSIIFEKQFLTISNSARGNTRFESLLGNLGLHDKLIPGGQGYKFSYDPINYETVDKTKRELQAFSIQYLKRALEG